MRHFCIAAALGLHFSLKLLMNLTEGRFVSKEVFAAMVLQAVEDATIVRRGSEGYDEWC